MCENGLRQSRKHHGVHEHEHERTRPRSQALRTREHTLKRRTLISKSPASMSAGEAAIENGSSRDAVSSSESCPSAAGT